MKKQYDYLLVGSGLFAGVFAYYAKKAGKTCLVLEKREHAGGNIYCENIEGINVLNEARITGRYARIWRGIMQKGRDHARTLGQRRHEQPPVGPGRHTRAGAVDQQHRRTAAQVVVVGADAGSSDAARHFGVVGDWGHGWICFFFHSCQRFLDKGLRHI